MKLEKFKRYTIAPKIIQMNQDYTNSILDFICYSGRCVSRSKRTEHTYEIMELKLVERITNSPTH